MATRDTSVAAPDTWVEYRSKNHLKSLGAQLQVDGARSNKAMEAVKAGDRVIHVIQADGGNFIVGQSIANSPAEIRRLRHRKRYTIPLIHFSELPTGISVKEFVHNHSDSIRKQKQALKNLSGPHYYPFEIRNNGAIRFHHGGYLSSATPELASLLPDRPPRPRPRDFDPKDDKDARKRQTAEVVRRRGQPKFRAALLEAYNGKCVITGCDAEDALEAAHISPYRGDKSHDLQNGLLLRADLHSLFDLGKLAIDPATKKVALGRALAGTSYADLEGQGIAQPRDPRSAPSQKALAQHFKWSSKIRAKA